MNKEKNSFNGEKERKGKTRFVNVKMFDEVMSDT